MNAYSEPGRVAPRAAPPGPVRLSHDAFMNDPG